MGEGVADGGLIDIGELGIAGPLTEDDETALGRALNRILASAEDGACNGFQASI